MSTNVSRLCFGCESLESRTLLCTTPVAPDAVIQWNNVALNAIEAEKEFAGPGFASRGLAMLHIAIYDAVNAIEGGYQPYLYSGPAPADANVDAAIAAAAKDVLVTVFPECAPLAQAAYDAALAAIPDGTTEDEGVAVGNAAADAIITARANDNALDEIPYTFTNEPGQYQPTPPDYPAPWGPGWGSVIPFGMTNAEDYQPPPPPALDSCAYAKAFNEVKTLGAADSTVRTADQTEIANFWSYDSQSYGTPLVLYNQIAQHVAEQEGNSVIENARLFALGNIAMGDAGIAVWKAKYDYNLWRPVTAIQQADTDGNPKTQADPNWMPLGYSADGIDHRTPPFPTYTSGHAAFGAAMFRTLAGFYGTDKIAFDATSDQVPGAVRHYNSFSQAARENALSRMLIGVHFSFDNNASLPIGRDVAAYDLAHLLLPNGSDGSETEVTFPVLGRNRSDQGHHGHDHHGDQSNHTTSQSSTSTASSTAALFSSQPIHSAVLDLTSQPDPLDAKPSHHHG